jgi:gliding motility-associated GldN-like protein
MKANRIIAYLCFLFLIVLTGGTSIAQCVDYDNVVLENAKVFLQIIDHEDNEDNIIVKQVIRIINAEECTSPLFGIIWLEQQRLYYEDDKQNQASDFNIWKALFQQADKGLIDCYNRDGTRKLKTAEIDAMIYQSIEYKNEQGIFEIDTFPVYPVQIFKFVVIEEWYITKSISISTKIRAIAPIINCVNEETGSFEGRKLLCWFIL